MDKFIEENNNIIHPNYFKEINYSEYDFLRHHTLPHISMVKLETLGEEPYIKEHFRKENLDFLFFTKNEEWESESEYRLIYFSKKKENEYCSIEQSLEQIHLGVDFSKSYLPVIKELCSNQQILQLQFLLEGLVCTPIN